MSQLIDKIVQAFNSILEYPVKKLLENAIGEQQLKSVLKFLQLSASGGSGNPNYAKVFEMINLIFSVLKPIGFALVATFFIIHMIEVVSKDALTLDSFIKGLIGLVLVISVAANAAEIMNAIFNLGEKLLMLVYNSITSPKNGTNLNSVIKNTASSMVTTYGAGSIAIALVIWFGHQIVIIGIDVAAFSRIIDIGWRAACMPIGIANSFEGGVNSSGAKFFKGFVASVISGVVMVIICAIGFSLSAALLSSQAASLATKFVHKGAMTLIAEVIAVEFATMGAAIAAPTKTKELFN